MIDNLLVLDPAKRYTSEEVLNHKWIASNTRTDDLEGTLAELKRFNARRKLRVCDFLIFYLFLFIFIHIYLFLFIFLFLSLSFLFKTHPLLLKQKGIFSVIAMQKLTKGFKFAALPAANQPPRKNRQFSKSVVTTSAGRLDMS